MIELQGDFWEIASKKPPQLDTVKDWAGIVVTINWTLKNDNSLVMGAGIAKQFADRYPFLPVEWGRSVKQFQYPRLLWRRIESGLYLIGLPTKINWRDPSPVELVISSLNQLLIFQDTLNPFYNTSILLTRPGCGHGGLLWSEVQPICADILSDDFFIVSNE